MGLAGICLLCGFLILSPIIIMALIGKEEQKDKVNRAIKGDCVVFGTEQVVSSYLNEECFVEISVDGRRGKVIFKYKNPIRDIEVHEVDKNDIYGVYYKNEFEVRREASALNVVLFGLPGLAMKQETHINERFPVYEYKYNDKIVTIVTSKYSNLTADTFKMYYESLKNKTIDEL